jgi:hypothetical protein
VFEVRIEILADLLADGLSEDARGLGDLPVLRQDLIGRPLLYFLDPVNVLLHSVPGYAQFAGYSLVGIMEFVQVDDSSYICHRFHLYAQLSAYLERGGFPSWGVKIESAKTNASKRSKSGRIDLYSKEEDLAVRRPL